MYKLVYNNDSRKMELNGKKYTLAAKHPMLYKDDDLVGFVTGIYLFVDFNDSKNNSLTFDRILFDKNKMEQAGTVHTDVLQSKINIEYQDKCIDFMVESGEVTEYELRSENLTSIAAQWVLDEDTGVVGTHINYAKEY